MIKKYEQYDWTPERIDELKRLWASGMSAAECAIELGVKNEDGGVGRSAVLGKLHRMGIKRSPLARSMQKKPPKPPRESVRRTFARDRGMHVLKLNGIPAMVTVNVPPVPAEDPPPAKMVALKDLDAGLAMCRWPFGDPRTAEFGFCGCETIPGQPYCAHHFQKAWVTRPARWSHQQAECTDRVQRAARVVKMGVEG